MAQPSGRSSWLPWSLAAILSFGVWQALPKLPPLAQAEPIALQIAALPGLLLAIVLSGAPRRLGRPSRLGVAWAVGTGASGALATLAVLWALASGGEGSVVAPLCALYPIVTALGSRVLLFERLAPAQTLGLVLFGGAVVAFAEPGAKLGFIGQGGWLGYAVVALVLYGASGITMKLASRHVGAHVAFAGWTGGFAAVSALLALALAPPIPQTIAFWSLATVYGLLLGFGLWTSFEAYRRGKAAVVTAVTALYPAVTVFLVVTLPGIGETLSLRKGLAVLLTLAAGVALAIEPAHSPG